jgi:hypothetical protein
MTGYTTDIDRANSAGEVLVTRLTWDHPRLKACSTGFPVLLETTNRLGIFTALKLLIPLLFFLRQGGPEGSRLAAMEV